MIIEQFELGMLQNNNFLVIDEETKEAMLVDCSEYTEDFKKTLDNYGAKLKFVLITHGHFDHIWGLQEFHENFKDVPILAPEGDRDLINDVGTFVDRFIGGLGVVPVPPITKYITENEELTLGNEKIKIIETAGHTKGGVCYLLGDNLFSGDTIFLGSVGRTDLPGGSFEQLRTSVKKVLDMLDDDVKIFTGHGENTTVKYEKAYNPVV